MGMDDESPRDQSSAQVRGLLEDAYLRGVRHVEALRGIQQPELDVERSRYGYGPDPETSANRIAASEAMRHERSRLMVTVAADQIIWSRIRRTEQRGEEVEESESKETEEKND